ncbi:Uncharacterized protein dnm_022860 [Desulfonema magnum]|uniref:Uncharacterized protein n=1 Tax=Desulfonema magnum TaxID=45655 RepID=A0A975GM46_9BACT|nr:Uncharacterized protein dnm_022860 [Desulfonema magnum]
MIIDNCQTSVRMVNSVPDGQLKKSPAIHCRVFFIQKRVQ